MASKQGFTDVACCDARRVHNTFLTAPSVLGGYDSCSPAPGSRLCDFYCCCYGHYNSGLNVKRLRRVYKYVYLIAIHYCHLGIVVVIVIANQDSTSSRLLPGSSYSCCIRNLHALVHKQCQPVHIMTVHEILQRRKWQLCKSTLPPNHSGGWTRKEKMGFGIHRKVVHSPSCTSLAATRKPNHSLMPAKFHPQVVDTEAKPSHAKHQRMWNAHSSTQIWMWSRLFTQRRGAKALHVSVLHCSTRMQELLPAAPSPKQNGLSYHVQVGRVAHVHLLTTQYTNTLEKPG
jgi:hypothetical protein